MESMLREDRNAVIRQHHNEPTAGPLGVAKTIDRMAQRYYWPGMFREIARYVRSCPTCLMHKLEQRPPAGQLHATNVPSPGNQLA